MRSKSQWRAISRVICFLSSPTTFLPLFCITPWKRRAELRARDETEQLGHVLIYGSQAPAQHSKETWHGRFPSDVFVFFSLDFFLSLGYLISGWGKIVISLSFIFWVYC
jgi:hypothetical protein